MKTVEPIRDPKKIEAIKNMLRGADKIRELVLFELGINSALRISDLLKTKVEDVFDERLEPRENFKLKEQKTNKNGIIYITPKVAETLKLYKKRYPSVVKDPNHFLFFRHKKFDSKTSELGGHPISPCMARILVRERCNSVGLKGSYGTHSLRKTWGFQARKLSVPLELIQHRLNHSSLSVTKRYLGITDDELQKVCLSMDL